MRALVCDGNDARLSLSHPEPGVHPGETIVRTRLAAVSPMDLELCRGLLGFTGVPGHQFVGVVEGTGGAVKRVVGSIHCACGACDLCRAGLAAHCRNQTILGVRGRDGCLAERFSLPAANLCEVPHGIDDDLAVFVIPVASAIQTARQLAIEKAPYITVLGDGVAGLIMVQVLAKLNASVRLLGWRPTRLALCERWGAKHRLAAEAGRRADQDVVVECTGTPEAMALALELVRPRGKVVLKSVRMRRPGEEPDLSPVVLKEIQLIGSGIGPVGEAMGMLLRREVDVLSLLGRRTRLDEGASLLRAAADPDALQVLVDV
jgi:threonine dehydrogenase-like Zn-dependent dehydrogenase